jgi:hypothetical protein
MAEKRRECAKCGLNRAERFYGSPRSRICSPCKKKGRGRTAKNLRLQDTYGITMDEYDRLYAHQEGRCAICQGWRAVLDVDHDHAVEREHGETRISVRGLLCRRCNRRLLPASKEDEAILRSAIEYVNHGREWTQRLLNG